VKAAQGGVTVSILGKEFMVACPEDEREALHQAARYLDEQMRRIQSGGKVLGVERCAVMAALNIAHELLGLRQQADGAAPEMDLRLKLLTRKIDTALAKEHELNA
jgi:cell division protein ZapA